MDPVIRSGATAPQFSLPGLDGRIHTLDEARGRILVLNFWSAECPWAERADQELVTALQDWGERVQLWTIASNANETAEQVTAEAARRSLPLVLLDAGQEAADLYGAQTTPHLFVIDEAGLLRYQGVLDDVTFRRRTPSIPYLRQAVDALLQGRAPAPAETPPYGCTIVRAYI
jgi:peroxiredoxin